MPRVVINTDDLRRLARWTKGGIGELGDIRVDVVRAGSVLEENPAAHGAYQQILRGIESVGVALTADHEALVNEVRALEAAEGAAPAAAPKPPATAGGSAMSRWPLFLLPVFLGGAAANRPPSPWNRAWVTEDGTVPTEATAMSANASQGFGEEWSAGTPSDTNPGQQVHARIGGDGWADSSSGGGSAQASIGGSLSAEVDHSMDVGPVHAQGEADASVTGEAHASASTHNGPQGAGADFSLGASVQASAHAGSSVNIGGTHAGADANAQAGAAADASGGVNVSKSGVTAHASGEAYAGGRVGARGDVGGPGGTRGSAGVGGNAGLGAYGSGSASVTTDDIGFEVDGGFALGLGVGVHLGFHFSPKKLWDDVTHPLDALTKPFSDVKSAADNFVNPSDGQGPSQLNGQPPPPPPPPPPADGGDTPGVLMPHLMAAAGHPGVHHEVGPAAAAAHLPHQPRPNLASHVSGGSLISGVSFPKLDASGKEAVPIEWPPSVQPGVISFLSPPSPIIPTPSLFG